MGIIPFAHTLPTDASRKPTGMLQAESALYAARRSSRDKG